MGTLQTDFSKEVGAMENGSHSECKGDDSKTNNHHSEVGPTQALYDLAKSSKWDEFIQRCESHPEDAKYAKCMGETMLGEDFYPVLHYLVQSQPMPPCEAFEAVAKAFPAAATIQSITHHQTPLHIAASNCSDKKSLEIFLRLLARMPSLGILLSELPLPPELIKENILPYTGGLLQLRDRTGGTVLRTLLQYGITGFHSEAVKAILTAAPELAAERNSFGGTPLHLAVFNAAPFAVLKTLIHHFPDALIMKGYGGRTPLSLYCQTAFFLVDGSPETRLQRMRLLAETVPRAVIIRNSYGKLPCEYLPRGDFAEGLYLRRVTEEQQHIPLTHEEITSGMFT